MQEDMPRLREAMQSSSPPLSKACLFPSFERLAVFAHQRERSSFSETLEEFVDR